MHSKAAQANRPAQHISGRFVSVGIIRRMAVRRTCVRQTPLPEREYHRANGKITNTWNLRFDATKKRGRTRQQRDIKRTMLSRSCDACAEEACGARQKCAELDDPVGGT